MPGDALVPGTTAGHTVCLLAKLGQVAYRLTEEKLLGLGLRVRHYSIVQALADVGGMSQAHLSTYLRIDPATIVASLDDLEQHGLVTRRRDTADRRRYVVDLTDKARDELPEIMAVIRSTQAAVFDTLADDQQRLLAELLGTLNTSATLLDSYDAIRRPGD